MKMEKRNSKWICWIVCITMALILSSLAMSCFGERYKTFTSEEGVPLFTFEYPNRYKVLYEPTPSVFQNLEIVRNVSGAEFLSYPVIAVARYAKGSLGTGDARATLEDHISSMSKYDEFQALNDSPIVLSGIEAEQITYSYVQDTRVGMGKYVVFDYNDLQWIIHAVYSADEENELNKVFDHFVQTFKILD